MNNNYSHLPGGNIISKGLKDLHSGIDNTEEALLVLIAGSKLRNLGVSVPIKKTTVPFEHQLYKLCLKNKLDSFRYYNSLIKQLVSFARALETSN